MKFVAMRELKINPSKVIAGARKEDMVVTRNGKPAAVLLAINEDTLEDYIFAKHPTFLKELEASYRGYKKKGGITHAEMRKRLGKRRV